MHKYLLALVFFLFGAPLQAQAQIDYHPSFEGCGYESSFISTDGFAQTVMFEAGGNLTGSIDIYWIDHSGNSQYFDTLAPGMFTNIDTFAGHGWVGILDGSCAYAQVYPGLQRVVFAFDY